VSESTPPRTRLCAATADAAARATADATADPGADTAGRRLCRSVRRAFLATGGALVVSFVLRPSLNFAQDAAKPAQPELPASLKKTPFLDSWIRIEADGRVHRCSPGRPSSARV
jgi:hypothetical protein